MQSDHPNVSEAELFVPITESLEQFKRHLCIPDNHRVLFSAPFGTGKTTFLKKFFKNKEDKYEVFHLFPVNYQVAENKDIFELLKYDILCELIPHIDFEEDTEQILSDKSIALQYLLLTDGANLALDILKLVPKLGKAVKSFDKIVNFCTKLGDLNKKQKDDKYELLDSFSKNINNELGSIYEMDPISNLIAEQIQQINTDKESVLIIDDLDRVDPKHIFRLLNVFSAHFDQDSPVNNKFGFSKIILVCDIENIEIIYRKLFGENVDFKGYIDKFRSVGTFTFDNRENWIQELRSITQVFREKNPHDYNSYIGFDKFIYPLIIDMLKSGLVDMRQLLKLNRFPVSLEIPHNLYFQGYSSIAQSELYLAYLILLFLFDSNKSLLDKSMSYLASIDESKLRNQIDKRLFEELIEILLYKNYPLKDVDSAIYNVNDQKISYRVANRMVLIDDINLTKYRKVVNIYSLCQKAFTIFDEIVRR